METESTPSRLSQIQTLWSLVSQANKPGDAAATDAQRQLLERYGGAVRRYLLGAVRNPDLADDLYQDFALQFLHGDLRGADPERGRFREFVKGVLFHHIANYHRRERGRFVQIPVNCPEPAVEPPSLVDSDRRFLESWREELLARAWTALADLEQRTGRPFHTVLRFRADHPDLASPQLAEALQPRLARSLTAAGIRQTLHRAREKFAALLLEAVAESLTNASPEQIEQELIDVGLREYCQSVLSRRANKPSKQP
jgi:RNA polymerase sigma-70 factor (ECF subfamily)